MSKPQETKQFNQSPGFPATGDEIESSEQGIPFIPLKDVLRYVIESTAVIAALLGMQHLGLFQPYIELLNAVKQLEILQEMLAKPQELLKRPELLEEYTMLFGFLLGCAENVYLLMDILFLKGLISTATMNWASTGTYTIEDDTGVRVQEVRCGDPRIEKSLKRSVILGVGYNGGNALMHMFGGMLLNKIAGGGVGAKFAVGYLMGRNFPTFLYQTLSDSVDMVKEGLGRRLFVGAVIKKHHPHDCGCAMCAISGIVPHGLKHSKGESHKAKIKMLDAISIPAQLVHQIAYRPLANLVLTPASWGGYFIRPTLEVDHIEEHH
ncbi:MAG: hypothetical protein HZA34_03320 [Candidatus Pacebacteria bacterium]|nr:hypothetical protein [Candidatus Paceibacterota bacterium]